MFKTAASVLNARASAEHISKKSSPSTNTKARRFTTYLGVDVFFVEELCHRRDQHENIFWDNTLRTTVR